MSIKWIGFDFGGTVADYSRFDPEKIIREVLEEYLSPTEITSIINKFLMLKKRYKGIGGIMEFGKDEFFEKIFENNKKYIKKYESLELDSFVVDSGKVSVLRRLKQRKLSLAIVSDVNSGNGLDIISGCLKKAAIFDIFDDVFTGLGHLSVNRPLDPGFKGLKKDGTIYEKLIDYFKKKDISPSEMLMVGDSIHPDIIEARKKKLNAVYYNPDLSVLEKCREADFKVSSFSDLLPIIESRRNDLLPIIEHRRI